MEDLLRQMPPITLAEMSGVKLMNRTDTKFVTTMPRLRLLLAMAQQDYFVQEIDGERNPLVSFVDSKLSACCDGLTTVGCSGVSTPTFSLTSGFLSG